MENRINKWKEKLNDIKAPEDLKELIKIITIYWLIETHGALDDQSLKNVVNTVFQRVSPNNKEFITDYNYYGETSSEIKEGDLWHSVKFVDDGNKIKLITILIHEIGHVVTDYGVSNHEITEYPLLKKTLTVCYNVSFKEGVMEAIKFHGYYLSDGFIETVSEAIFKNHHFRQEIAEFGYDLTDYEYKDKRFFSSRVYDEYKIIYQLFNALLNGKLFEFATKKYDSDTEIYNEINKYRLNVLFDYIKCVNSSLWQLKQYENKNRDRHFDSLVEGYINNKETILHLVSLLLPQSNNKEEVEFLLNRYINTIDLFENIPFTKEEKQTLKFNNVNEILNMN